VDFIITLCISVIFFCLGTVTSYLIKILKRKFSSSQKKSFDFILICLALSFALITFSCTIVYIYFTKAKFSLNFYDLFFLLGIFTIGILISLFPKVFLPLTLILYIGLTFASYKIIKTKYDFFISPQSISLSKDSLLVEKTEYKISFDENNFPSLIIQQCTLPSKLLVPLPRTFYKISGTSYMNENSNKNFLYKWIFSDEKQIELPLKKQKILPVLYTLNASRSLGKMYFELKIIF
jgi:hypothetical protein